MPAKRVTTAEALTSAAATLFETRGYHNTTIDDIAEAAGVSRPTVYKYVPSKQALLDYLVDSICDAQEGELRAALTAGTGPLDRLSDLIGVHIESSISRKPFYAIVFSEQIELSDKARRRFHEFSHQVAADLQALLEECLQSRPPSPVPVDTWIASNLVLSMLTSLYRWYDPTGPVGPDSLRRQISLLLEGILPTTASK
ncbi:TetR/AcrR family transcriptional regulator [Mycolicibacterium sp.]